MKKRLLFVLISTLTTGFAVQAKFHPSDEHHPISMRALKHLELSETQREDIRQLIKEYKEDGKLTSKGRKEHKRQPLNRGFNSETIDEVAITQAAINRLEQSQPRRLAQAKLRHQIFHVLNSEQQQELAQKEEKPRRHDIKKRGNKSSGIFDTLTLTEAQQTQLSQLREEAKAHQTARATRKEYQAKETAIIQAENFDEAQWLALQEEYQSAWIESTLQKAREHIAMMAVLTPEQREELKRTRSFLRDRKPHREHRERAL